MNPTTNIRALVRGTYDMQKLRIQCGNRVVAQFKAKLGQAPGESEDTLDADAKRLLKDLREVYQRIADANLRDMANGTGDELISDLAEFALVEGYFRQLDAEETQFERMKAVVAQDPLWGEFLEGVKGCGPAMAGVLMSEIDIARSPYPSSIWKYAGLDVAEDGRGRSRRKEHLIDFPYTNAKGEPATRKSITFNPFLRTKLLGVLGPSFVKQVRFSVIDDDTGEFIAEHVGGKKAEKIAKEARAVKVKAAKQAATVGRDSKARKAKITKAAKKAKGKVRIIRDFSTAGSYCKIYFDYKLRLESRDDIEHPFAAPVHHLHAMALRYAVKMFLKDYYNHARALAGLPVAPTYQEAKLDKAHADAYRAEHAAGMKLQDAAE